jgi:hypothetical protein
MDLDHGGGSEARFAAYLEGVASVIGHPGRSATRLLHRFGIAG